MPSIPFNNTYIKLGEDFYTKTKPTPVANPKMIKFNTHLARELGLDVDAFNVNGPIREKATAVFAGNTIPEGADPLAMAYAGHQFGGFNPQLGDGRAILLGEIISPDGIRLDMQLKGSGPTPFSRGGDGRAALGPVLREYLLSEAMAKLGVPTTRALAAVTTGEEVARTQLLPGAIITRIATGFVRVGTFQYFSSKGDEVALKKLADYVIERNFPDIDATNIDTANKDSDNENSNPYEAFLKAVINRQAALIAQWMQLGFIHGVMNTDNMSIVGETIDYGPCAFMDEFDHQRVYSSIDRQGRYAYSNQPSIGQWNLVRLAETLLPLFIEGEHTNEKAEAAVAMAQDALKAFSTLYEAYWLEGMQRKLGLLMPQDDDRDLIENLLNTMADNQADFTLTFYYLSKLEADQVDVGNKEEQSLRALFTKPQALDSWVVKWRARLEKESAGDQERQTAMQAVNPVYIPRNHQVEAAIRVAEDHNDFSVFYELHDVLQNPYEYQQGREAYMLPPEPEEVVQQTFCGT